jgi:hypothetical protein
LTVKMCLAIISAMKPTSTAYTLRNIPTSLWRQVKIQAAHRGESIRAALLRALADYCAGKT